MAPKDFPIQKEQFMEIMNQFRPQLMHLITVHLPKGSYPMVICPKELLIEKWKDDQEYVLGIAMAHITPEEFRASIAENPDHEILAHIEKVKSENKIPLLFKMLHGDGSIYGYFCIGIPDFTRKNKSRTSTPDIPVIFNPPKVGKA